MNLIKDFNITPFTRIAWVSAEAKKVWEPAIQSCAAMVSDLEVDSVAAGHRPCAWRTIPREQLPEFSKQCAGVGLIVLPVRWVGSFPGNGFLHYTPEGDSQVYCIIARTIQDAKKFLDAFEAGDHEGQGKMLGFPECCRKAFAENWKAGYFDPIWQSACADYPLEMPTENRLRKIKAHPYSNPLLRYIGLRVGFHIPCSFNCDTTIRAGEHRLSIAKNKDAVTILNHLLMMPMTAELYHGILQVRTPLFYLITYSVPTAEKYTIDVDGEFFPREGK